MKKKLTTVDMFYLDNNQVTKGKTFEELAKVIGCSPKLIEKYLKNKEIKSDIGTCQGTTNAIDKFTRKSGSVTMTEKSSQDDDGEKNA